jgi:hypothetical protein
VDNKEKDNITLIIITFSMTSAAQIF